MRRKQNALPLRPAGAPNGKAATAAAATARRTAPDTPAPNVWRSVRLLHFYKLNWYITKKKKNKAGQEAAFSTSEETVRIHPFALRPEPRLPHPATLSRTLTLSERPGDICPEFIKDLWKHFSN